MKKKMVAMYLAGIISMVVFSSCTKTVLLSNGEQTKKIKVVGEVSQKRDSLNNMYTSFESVKGTKYNINSANYIVIVK